MIKKLLPSVFLFATCLSAFAQGQADKWHFGTNASIDFTSGTATATAGTSALQSIEGTASIANASGALLFYTNGMDVWDNTNTVMTNGSGLMGDISSTQTMIVPSPTSNTQYYIFTVAPDGGSDGFRYSIVDMALNSGLGDVVPTSKNVFITDSTTEKIAAIKDNADGYWIVMHVWGTNAFEAYHLTSAPFPSTPVISRVGSVHINAGGTTFQNGYGQMKFNMCGTRLALAIGYQNTIELFDFDLGTGVVSNPVTLGMLDHVYGVEFSKSSQLLYATTYDDGEKLVQMNITLPTAGLILASKTVLSTTDALYAMQMGPDGKIYVSRSFGTSYLGRIDNPETIGIAANYTDLGIDLDPGGLWGVNGALGLPSFMQTFLKTALSVTCPTVGIEEEFAAGLNPVFPNPSADGFSIDLSNLNETVSASIYDHTGRLIEEHRALTGVFQFGKTYDNGIYLLNLRQGNQSRTFRVVKM